MLRVDISWVRNHTNKTEPLLPFTKLGEGKKAPKRFRRKDIIKFYEERMNNVA